MTRHVQVNMVICFDILCRTEQLIEFKQTLQCNRMQFSQSVITFSLKSHFMLHNITNQRVATLRSHYMQVKAVAEENKLALHFELCQVGRIPGITDRNVPEYISI